MKWIVTKKASDQMLSRLGIKPEDLDNSPGRIIEFIEPEKQENLCRRNCQF